MRARVRPAGDDGNAEGSRISRLPANHTPNAALRPPSGSGRCVFISPPDGPRSCHFPIHRSPPVISHCLMSTARPHPFLASADRKSDRDTIITSQLMRVAGAGVVDGVRRPFAYPLAVIFPRC
jgi:hypothetical protein